MAGAAALAALRDGVTLKDGPTRPAEVEEWRRPAGSGRAIRRCVFAKSVPEAWLRLTITEGRNRQVRRMCAHVWLAGPAADPLVGGATHGWRGD